VTVSIQNNAIAVVMKMHETVAMSIM